MNDALLAQAQAFVDRKYVVMADERQKAMGLGYVTAERTDLAREIVRFVESVGDPEWVMRDAQKKLEEAQARIATLETKLEDTQRRLRVMRNAHNNREHGW
jgi:hypothetical protein